MDITTLEERIAHLLRITDDLSDTVAAQAKEIDRLTARVEMLMMREAEREAEVRVALCWAMNARRITSAAQLPRMSVSTTSPSCRRIVFHSGFDPKVS
jgi:SlyX protein